MADALPAHDPLALFGPRAAQHLREPAERAAAIRRGEEADAIGPNLEDLEDLLARKPKMTRSVRDLRPYLLVVAASSFAASRSFVSSSRWHAW